MLSQTQTPRVFIAAVLLFATVVTLEQTSHGQADAPLNAPIQEVPDSNVPGAPSELVPAPPPISTPSLASAPASVVPPTSPATPSPPPAATLAAVSAKFAATFYGFVEFDSIYDSTQSFNDLAGNGAIARSGTYAGDHGRMIFGARKFLNTDVMMAGIAVIAIIGLVLEKLVFQKIEDYTVVRWGMITAS